MDDAASRPGPGARAMMLPRLKAGDSNGIDTVREGKKQGKSVSINRDM